MKIISKNEVVAELSNAVEKFEFIKDVGKASGKSYLAVRLVGKNGKNVLKFLTTNDLLHLGLVYDDSAE